jgi:hypothetical protein
LEELMATFITLPGGKTKKFSGRFCGHDTVSRAKYERIDGFRPKDRTLPHFMQEVDVPDLRYYPTLSTENGVSCGPANIWPDSDGDHFIAI